MDNKHKKILLKKRAVLVESVNVQDGLYTQLRVKKIITPRMENRIKLNSTPHEQVEKLLDLLPKRGPKAFQAFCIALKKDDQEWVVDEHLSECPDPSNPPQLAASSPASEKRRALSPWNHLLSEKSSSPERTRLQKRKLEKNLTENESQHELETSTGLLEKFSKKNTGGPASPASSSNEDAHQTDGHVDVLVEPCSRQFYEDHCHEAYEMEKNPRGLALIFNINGIKGKPPRQGTDIDRNNLVQLLKLLHFTPVVYNDGDGLSSQEIVEKIKECSESPQHEKSDALIVCLLSHGEEGHILGTDGEQVSLEEIYQLFANDRCKHLRGKPKIFIHQACRGDKKDKGVRMDHTDEDSGNKLPTSSDMLFCYPTLEGYVAWRNQEHGSWYIQALVRVFMEHAKNEDICAMLHRVNQLVSEMTSSGDEMCQMSEFRSTLCKPRLYFFPGIDNPVDSLRPAAGEMSPALPQAVEPICD